MFTVPPGVFVVIVLKRSCCTGEKPRQVWKVFEGSQGESDSISIARHMGIDVVGPAFKKSLFGVCLSYPSFPCLLGIVKGEE